MTREQADRALMSARFAAQVLTDVGFGVGDIGLGVLPLEDVRALAEVAGVEVGRQFERTIIIEHASVLSGGVRIRWQGSRPMVAADLEVRP